MLIGQDSQKSQRLPRQGRQCPPCVALVPTTLPGVLEGAESVPDSEVPGSDQAEPTLEDVGREFPTWHCYAPGVNEFVYAKLPDSFPLVIVRGKTPADLGSQIRRWIGD